MWQLTFPMENPQEVEQLKTCTKLELQERPLGRTSFSYVSDVLGKRTSAEDPPLSAKLPNYSDIFRSLRPTAQGSVALSFNVSKGVLPPKGHSFGQLGTKIGCLTKVRNLL